MDAHKNNLNETVLLSTERMLKLMDKKIFISLHSNTFVFLFLKINMCCENSKEPSEETVLLSMQSIC